MVSFRLDPKRAKPLWLHVILYTLPYSRAVVSNEHRPNCCNPAPAILTSSYMNERFFSGT